MIIAALSVAVLAAALMQQPAPAEGKAAVECGIIFNGYGTDVRSQLEVDIGKTAFEVMADNYDIGYAEFEGMGAYITSINGVSEDLENKMFWMFYVDGKEAEVGASSFRITQPTSIEFRYETASW